MVWGIDEVQSAEVGRTVKDTEHRQFAEYYNGSGRTSGMDECSQRGSHT